MPFETTLTTITQSPKARRPARHPTLVLRFAVGSHCEPQLMQLRSSFFRPWAPARSPSGPKSRPPATDVPTRTPRSNAAMCVEPHDGHVGTLPAMVTPPRHRAYVRPGELRYVVAFPTSSPTGAKAGKVDAGWVQGGYRSERRDSAGATLHRDVRITGKNSPFHLATLLQRLIAVRPKHVSRAFLLAAFVVAGCSRGNTAAPDASPTVATAAAVGPASPPLPSSATPSAKAFGAACVADTECEGSVCFHKRLKGSDAGRESRTNNDPVEHDGYCSMRCHDDADCPVPLTKGRCGARGMCKRPD